MMMSDRGETMTAINLGDSLVQRRPKAQFGPDGEIHQGKTEDARFSLFAAASIRAWQGESIHSSLFYGQCEGIGP